MQNSRCLSSSATALYRVFIAPAESTPKSLSCNAPRAILYSPRPNAIAWQQRRGYRDFVNIEKQVAEKGPPRNKEITAFTVRLVNAENRVDEPRLTFNVLAGIDFKTHALVQVQEGEDGQPPICKIINKADEYKKMKEKKQRAKQQKAKSVTKTIEVNWAIEEGDLEHRLQRMKGFLEKGYSVELLLAGKKNKKQATRGEALAVVARIKEAVGEVKGAREKRKMEGKLLEQAVLAFAGVDSKAEEVPQHKETSQADVKSEQTEAKSEETEVKREEAEAESDEAPPRRIIPEGSTF